MERKVDSTVVYSLITRPLIVAVKEMAELGFTREQIAKELSFALRKGLRDADTAADRADAFGDVSDRIVVLGLGFLLTPA